MTIMKIKTRDPFDLDRGHIVRKISAAKWYEPHIADRVSYMRVIEVINPHEFLCEPMTDMSWQEKPGAE